MLLCSVEDFICLWIKLLDVLVYNVCAIFGAKRLRDPLNAPLGLKQLISSYKDTYLGSNKVYNLYFTHVFSDPLYRSRGGFRR